MPRVRRRATRVLPAQPGKRRPAPFALKVPSASGKRDGLYWPTRDNEADNPLGPLFASARAAGYKPGQGKPAPYHGDYYHVITGHGPAAHGGAYSYLAHGKRIGGFALVPYSASYDTMTFIVNQDGVVYLKDLGPKTASLAKAMKTFNPDSTWTRVENGGVGQP